MSAELAFILGVIVGFICGCEFVVIGVKVALHVGTLKKGEKK
jgi:hypothetical protein